MKIIFGILLVLVFSGCWKDISPTLTLAECKALCAAHHGHGLCVDFALEVKDKSAFHAAALKCASIMSAVLRHAK